MDISEEKITPLFHKLIDEIEDKAYLKKVYESLSEQFNVQIDFNDFDLKDYKKSMAEVKKGNYFTNDQVKLEAQQWLKK